MRARVCLPGLLLLLAGSAADPAPSSWPAPNATARPTYHLGGLDNFPGYVGDANGMMFREGLFHVAWQCQFSPDSGLNWCHATSPDFVVWTALPPMYNRTGGGAESGGVAQLPDGDVVAIFNQIGGGGHWQARPVNITDPHLTQWRYTHPNGTTCEDKTACVVTPGIPGTDLSQAFLDGSGDGFWRVVANRAQGGGATGAAMLARTKDFKSFKVESQYHEYKWTRCVTLPTLCGFGPYPRDPNTFEIPGTDGIYVLYGMQKTCSFSGREFYALGKYNSLGKHVFRPLDNRSDYANNVWDGGEGYASMHVFDPIKKRMLWIPAVIEGDRDACGDKTGEGFWRSWLIERDIGRGWFGTLGLPRVVTAEDLSPHQVEGSTDVHLLTPALPELAALRAPGSAFDLPPAGISLQAGELWSGRATKSSRTYHGKENDHELPRGNSMEYLLRLKTGSVVSSTSADVGLRVLWDDEDEEFTRVGVRDGTYLEGVDLWDEVNGDSYAFNITTVSKAEPATTNLPPSWDAKANACRSACIAATEHNCTAWTLSDGGLCRFKAEAQHALQVASNNGAFQPYHKGCISGYVHRPTLRYMSLYVDRAHSTTMVPRTNKNFSYPKFNYAKLLAVVVGDVKSTPTKNAVKNVVGAEEEITLRVFVDRSIIEVFAQGGRSVVTARVYPAKPTSNRVGLYNGGSKRAVVTEFKAWTLKSALAPTTPDRSRSDRPAASEDTETEKELESAKHAVSSTTSSSPSSSFLDPRDITNGVIMLEEIYTDQPYCAQFPWASANRGIRWTCVVTVNDYIGTDHRSEGGDGEHIVSIYSDDQGATWSESSSVELAPPQNVANAYGNIVASRPLPSNQGKPRLYVVYNLNYDNITSVPGRDDELGYFYMKSSDDGGVTWSDDRHRVAYPKTWIDKHNTFNGSTNIMWTVDHIKTDLSSGIVSFAFTKIGAYVQNPPEEVFVMRSTNLLDASDPSDIEWQMLPENSDHGIMCPEYYNCNKTVMEEGHYLPLTSVPNRAVVMARTSMGFLAAATRDGLLQPIGGDDHTRVARYWNNTVSGNIGTPLVPLSNVTAQDGKRVLRSGVKHPRGPFTPKQLAPGVWLMLYYNNGGGGWYGRDPYFLSCGREVNGTFGPTGLPEILWSQPEIALYDREYRGGTSGGGYPDFIFVSSELAESENSHEIADVYISAAQKGLPQPTKSRSYLSRVDPTLIQGLLSQHVSSGQPKGQAPLLSVNATHMNMPIKRPELSATGNAPLSARQGFSIVFVIDGHGAHAKTGDTIFHGEYMTLGVGSGTGGLSLNFSYIDGRGGSFNGGTGPTCTGLLVQDGAHHVSIVADGGPNIVSFVIDGVYCDGSWSFLPASGMGEIPATSSFTVHSQDTANYGAGIRWLNVYNAALRTSESVAMYRDMLSDEEQRGGK